MQVDILLSTYNGAAYIGELLESLQAQTTRDWILWIRDDSSSDDTRELCESFERKDSRIRLLPVDIRRLGASGSFGELLIHVAPHGRYVMFCDQDDRWHADKIEITLQALLEAETDNQTMPLLVHTDLVVVDETLRVISPSYWTYENKNPDLNTFRRLLVQNTVTGCTAMINKPLLDLAHSIPVGAAMHDWWLALLAAAFGRIVPIRRVTIDYRQHSQNVFGAQAYTLANMISAAVALFSKQEFARRRRLLVERRVKQAADYLAIYGSRLNKRDFAAVNALATMSSTGFFGKRWSILANGLFLQNLVRTLGLLVLV